MDSMNSLKSNLFEEVWTRYQPAYPILKPPYDIISIKDNMDNLKIILHSTKCNQKLEVIFGSSWAHRKSYETFRLNLVSQLSKQYGSEFYVEWSFFKIDNSNYLKWLSEESNRWTDKLKLNHFVIIGVDFIMDIIATEEPQIKAVLKKINNLKLSMEQND